MLKTLSLLIAVVAFTSAMYAQKAELKVTSSSFEHNELIPLKYSCQGENINPALTIRNVPDNTISLAVIMHDPDAPMKGGYTHWVMWNVDPRGNIPEDFSGAMQGHNSSGKKGYVGMCPPGGTHHYEFRVYALDTEVQLFDDISKDALEKAMEGMILAKGVLTGLYKKQ